MLGGPKKIHWWTNMEHNQALKSLKETQLPPNGGTVKTQRMKSSLRLCVLTLHLPSSAPSDRKYCDSEGAAGANCGALMCVVCGDSVPIMCQVLPVPSSTTGIRAEKQDGEKRRTEKFLQSELKGPRCKFGLFMI